jgi:hypothetical protein
MPTTTASLTISSADLTSSPINISATTNLTEAGTGIGLQSTSGLARRETESVTPYVLYRSDDYADDKSHKVYLKNLSVVSSEYFTVYLTGDRATGAHDATDQSITGLTEVGRLYAGDFAFIPWNSASGTKEAFTVTVANTWAAGDTFAFDGVTVVAANSTVANVASQINNAYYPNWTTSVDTAVVTFTSRTSRADLEIDTTEAVTTTAGDGTGAVATTVTGTKSLSDIYIKPSVATSMTLESMLIYQAV